MPLGIAQVIVSVFELYAAAGVAFALLFLPRGLERVDPRMAGSPKALRLLILPGVIALWPLFARRWIAGRSEPVERTPHRSRGSRDGAR